MMTKKDIDNEIENIGDGMDEELAECMYDDSSYYIVRSAFGKMRHLARRISSSMEGE